MSAINLDICGLHKHVHCSKLTSTKRARSTTFWFLNTSLQWTEMLLLAATLHTRLPSYVNVLSMTVCVRLSPAKLGIAFIGVCPYVSICLCNNWKTDVLSYEYVLLCPVSDYILYLVTFDLESYFQYFYCWAFYIPGKHLVIHCVPKNVHLFIFQITLSKINRF